MKIEPQVFSIVTELHDLTERMENLQIDNELCEAPCSEDILWEQYQIMRKYADTLIKRLHKEFEYNDR